MAGSLLSMVAIIMRIVISHDLTLHQSAEGMLWALLEQSLVIAMGSAPVLAAIRRLPIVKSFSASLASLVEKTPLGSFMGSRKGSNSGGSGGRGRRGKPYSWEGSDPGGEKAKRDRKHVLNTVTVFSTFNMSRLHRDDAQSLNSNSENGLVDREVVPSYPPPVAGSRKIVVSADRDDGGRMV